MPQYQLLKKLPPRPRRRTQIFRLARPQVNQKILLELAQRFGLKGNLDTGRLCQDARQMTYLEASFELSLHHASGGLRFHDNARWQVDDGSANVTFDDEVAIKMAQRFIKEFSIVPLKECKVLKVTHLNVGVVERQTGHAEQRVVDVGVAFQRVIDNIPVEGPGGKVMVYIDHKGELTGIDRLWREIQEVSSREVELQSPDYAQQEVMRHWGDHGTGLIAIDDIRFGYFEMGWNDAQRYLQPAYYMPLTLTATEGPFAGRPVMLSEHVVPAATKSPESLMPRRPVVATQAPRYQQSTA